MNKDQRKISPTILVTAWIAGIAIIALNVYQIIEKFSSSNTTDIWQDFALILLAVLLLVRVLVMHRKQK